MYHGVATCSRRQFCSEFFTQISEHFHAYFSLHWAITLIWVSLERSFPPAELEYRWCQYWSKVITSVVQQRPTLVTASYRWHRSQWVNNHRPNFYLYRQLKIYADGCIRAVNDDKMDVHSSKFYLHPCSWEKLICLSIEICEVILPLQYHHGLLCFYKCKINRAEINYMGKMKYCITVCKTLILTIYSSAQFMSRSVN